MPDSTNITTSGGIITSSFIEAIRQPSHNHPMLKPGTFATRGAGDRGAAFDRVVAETWELLLEDWERVRGRLHDFDVSMTRRRWLLPLFQWLDFEPQFLNAAVQVGELRFPVSHRGWPDDAAPVLHLVAPAMDLDRKPNRGGKTPHDLVQTYLNASPEQQWGVVSNGVLLRVLRDYHHTYTRGFVEFDLEGLFETKDFADFRALFRLVHASRFVPGDEGLCPLEQFYKDSVATGVQVGKKLRPAVVAAIETLGNGFLSGPLLTELQGNEQQCARFFSEILHVVYRILFLLFAEQQGMMPGRNSLYADEYSITRLRERAEQQVRSADHHRDLWEGLKVTFDMLHRGVPELHVFGYNGMLFDDQFTKLLNGLTCRNAELLEAVRYLSLMESGGVLQRISYADLGVEELGSVYESLLDYTPRVTTDAETVEDRDIPANHFFLDPRGSARKAQGAYYTHPSLVNQLIESALIPVLEDRLSEAVGERAWSAVGGGRPDEKPGTPLVMRRWAEAGADGEGVGGWGLGRRKQGASHGDTEFSGSHRLAAGHGPRDGGLPRESGLAQGGTVRSDQPGPPSGSLDSGEHRGGPRPPASEGVPPVRGDRPGVAGGVGDPPGDREAPGVPDSGSSSRPGTGDGRTRPDAQRPGQVPERRDTEAPPAPTPNPQPPTPPQRGGRGALAITLCDPAPGSGAFLIAATNALGLELARIRSGTEYPDEPVLREAKREVLQHCIYGVDINPMAVELCKVSLWINACVTDKPLNFLDHHIKCGNSLIGWCPGVGDWGLGDRDSTQRDSRFPNSQPPTPNPYEIPDDAFKPVTGDDKTVASAIRKRNKREREREAQQGLLPLFGDDDTTAFAPPDIDDLPENTPAEVAAKRDRYLAWQTSQAWLEKRTAADLWTAAFFVELTDINDPRIPTTARLRQYLDSPKAADGRMVARARALASAHRFFHWGLEFPEVFGRGGFDVVLGNPPWDTLSPDKKEFFAVYDAGIRHLDKNGQDALVAQLLSQEGVEREWQAYCRKLYSDVNFFKTSGRFVLYAPGNLGKGDFNVYRMFVEQGLRLAQDGGYAAMVVPGGLYGGANASAIRQFILDQCQLRRLYGLINNSRGWFSEVDIDRFTAFAAERGGRTDEFVVQFGLSGPQDLAESPVLLQADLLRQLSPETYAVPDLRERSELSTLQKMHGPYPVFGSPEPVPYRHYQAEVHMGNDRELFTTDPEGLPLYEGRMIDQFDHRAKTYESGHGRSALWTERPFGDPGKAIIPRWRVLAANIPSKLGDRCERYRACFCDVAAPRNSRSLVAALLPPGVICGDKVPTVDFGEGCEWYFLPWLAVANSLAMDWLARTRITAQKMSFTVMDGLPFPRPKLDDALTQTVAPTVLRLVCTAPEMTPYWNQMAALGFVVPVPDGTVPPDALIDPDARALARAELDAYVAREVFGLTAEELSAAIDTFGALQRAEERDFGEFRTKRLVMEAWERIAAHAGTFQIQPRGT